jgi:hypothetical protein
MRDLFHTRVAPALLDASTWPSLATIVTAAAILPSPFSWIVILLAVPGVILKGAAKVN